MKSIKLALTINLALIGMSVNAETLNCPNMTKQSDGAKVCHYNLHSARSYALENWDRSNYLNSSGAVTDGYFASYDNNCTNFVSQSVLAGISEKHTRKDLFAVREQYFADRYDYYSWFYKSKWTAGNAWKGVQSLYLYADYTSRKDPGPTYKENGPKFKLITYNTPSKKLDIDSVKTGDVIFMDYEGNAEKEHVFIVTNIQNWRFGYDEIRVASNTKDYSSKGLGTINKESNELNGRYPIFHVYRPTAYVELQ